MISSSYAAVWSGCQGCWVLECSNCQLLSTSTNAAGHVHTNGGGSMSTAGHFLGQFSMPEFCGVINVKLWKWGYGSKGASIARRATALHQELPFTTNDMIHPSQRSRRFWSPVSVLPALKPWHQSRSLDLVHSPWKHGQHKPIPGNITCRRIWLSETHACAGGMKVSRTRLQPSATAIFISTNRAQMCRPGISERAPPPWVTHLASEG